MMPDNTPNPKQKNIATFSVDSASYAKYRPTYPSEFFAYLADLCPAKDLAWDVATGNGQAAFGEAEYFGRVIANDMSREQLAEARPHPRVEYRQCTAETAGIPDGTVDLVTVASALHWLNLDTFFPAVIRALKPNGVFACFGYKIAPEEPKLGEAIEAFRKERLAPYQAASSRDFGQNYEKLSFPFRKVETPEFQIVEEWTLERFCRHFGTTSAVKRCLRERGSDPVGDVAARLAPIWGEGARRIRMKLRLWVGLNARRYPVCFRKRSENHDQTRAIRPPAAEVARRAPVQDRLHLRHGRSHLPRQQAA